MPIARATYLRRATGGVKDGTKGGLSHRLLRGMAHPRASNVRLWVDVHEDAVDRWTNLACPDSQEEGAAREAGERCAECEQHDRRTRKAGTR